MNLDEIREHIDEIDGQLLRLFLKRMEYTDLVADYKIEHHIPVLNAAREAEIIKEVSAAAGEKINEAALLFNTMMDISRTGQYKKMAEAMSVKTPPTPNRVAFAGLQGSFTHFAARQMYENCDFIEAETFESVFESVRGGSVDCGVVPCENSFAGSVTEVYDLLTEYGFYILSSIRLPVRHCLMGYGKAEEIDTVYSHPQAISQCDAFIKAHNLTAVAFANTSVAAKAVMEKKDRCIAAIGSVEAARHFELPIVCENIQSSSENTTRFISVSKDLYVKDNADQIAIAFSLPHTAGSLYRALAKIAACGLNLTKIESRPNKETIFEYIFYVEFSGKIQDRSVLSLLSGFEKECKTFYFLGNYDS